MIRIQNLPPVTDHDLEVYAADQAGHGGAHHIYLLKYASRMEPPLARIDFQNGPIAEVGVNGLTHEALVQVIVHRLQCFQAGPYACRENAIALTKLEEALHWLNHRTLKRAARGVEGTHAV